MATYEIPQIPKARWRITDTGACAHALDGKDVEADSICEIEGERFVKAVPPPSEDTTYYPACCHCIGRLTRRAQLAALPKVIRDKVSERFKRF